MTDLLAQSADTSSLPERVDRGERRTRTDGERLRDLEVVSSLYLRGAKPAEIAAHLQKTYGYRSLSSYQIQFDLAELRKMWVQSALINYDEAKAREIAHIDELEGAAWEAWSKSWGEQATVTHEGIEDQYGNQKDEAADSKKPTTYSRKRATETKKNQLGDPRYLDTIKWCIEHRCKIMGLHEPTRMAISWKTEAEKHGITQEDADALYGSMVKKITGELRDRYIVENSLPPINAGEEEEFDDVELPDEFEQ